jgi:double-stranded uracil-DNA glycosylase
MAKKHKPAYEHLRLTDAIEPGVRVLLVGINPGVLSAVTGHHFAGPTNRFWGLLYESGIVPEPITHEDDVRLPEWGIGMTNLVARPSPGIDVLKPEEYVAGWRILEKKIDRYRPRIVAFVGVTMYRALRRMLAQTEAAGSRAKPTPKAGITLGFQSETVHGARLFVLPNPSGRNAHFQYDAMLAAFRKLARAMRRLPASE